MAICLVYETFQALERGKNPGEGRGWQEVGIESVEEDWKEEVGETRKDKGGVRSPFYRANLIACACRYRLSDLVGMLPCSCLHLFSKRLAIVFLQSKLLDSGSVSSDDRGSADDVLDYGCIETDAPTLVLWAVGCPSLVRTGLRLLREGIAS